MNIQNRYNNVSFNNFSSYNTTTTATNTLCFSSNNSKTDYLQKNLAARKIQLFFKKFLAAKAYKHMFDNGEYFKQYKEISSSPKSLVDYLTIAQKLSDKAIKEIKNHLGELTDQEQAFLQRIINLPNFTLRHQTAYNLDHLNSKEESTLTIKSNRCLNESGAICRGLTKQQDITALSNNDFVFFSVSFDDADLAIKPEYSEIGDNTDYGYKAYLTHHKNGTLGYFTLTDHFHNGILPSDIRCIFCKTYPRLQKHIYEKIHGSLGNKDIPMFTEKDMRLGLAYHSIYIIRKTECRRLKNFIYQNCSLPELNEFLTVIFTPEFHIPRILSTTDFKSHKLRSKTTEEFYKLLIFYKNTDMIRENYFSKYSTKGELINITTYQDIRFISATAREIRILIKEAIKDANVDVLSCCVYWLEEILNTRCKNLVFLDLSDYKVCLSILQRNIDKIPEYANKYGSCYIILSYLKDILLKTEDFNDEIYLYLTNISDNTKNIVEIACLYTIIGKIEDIPECIIKNISYNDIPIKLIYEGIFDSESESVKLHYAKLIAKLITQNKYNLEEFSKSLYIYVHQYLPELIFKILEDNFLGILCNPNITEEARNTLQQAFINSKILNPDKKINSSTNITLKDYTKKYYNIDL
jgi:hypothetical protein